jgi:hypothetical protein
MAAVYQESDRLVILDNGPNGQKLHMTAVDELGQVWIRLYGARGGEHGSIRVSASDLRRMLVLTGIAKRAR